MIFLSAVLGLGFLGLVPNLFGWRRLRDVPTAYDEEQAWKTRVPPRWDRWDSTEAEVLEFADRLRVENAQAPAVVLVGDVPIVPGPGEPTVILPALSHRSDQTATTPLSYRPRHAATGPAAIRSVTREFAQLVRDNFGVHVTGRAPVEAELAREWAVTAT